MNFLNYFRDLSILIAEKKWYYSAHLSVQIQNTDFLAKSADITQLIQ